MKKKQKPVSEVIKHDRYYVTEDLNLFDYKMFTSTTSLSWNVNFSKCDLSQC